MKKTLMEESFKKITESFDLSDYSIMTDTGYKKLTKLHKTVPYEVYELTLKNGMSLKCADNHIVFIQECDEESFLKTSLKEVFVKNLRPGSFVCVDDNGQISESEVVSVINLGYEEEMYDFELTDESDHRYYTNGILSHNTALIETLAIKIANNQVSRILQDKIIYQLDLTSVIAGTKYRGQFEERMKVIIDEIEKDPNIIMFIDEIHTIVGTGNASGSLDVSNILKPALARGTLQCIGATTIDEYKKYIETDHALERRFQKILVKPSTKEQTKEILMRAKDKYEIHHLVDFPEDAIEACVDLADRYITSRFFPDKALDVLDEVGARVHIKNIVVPQYILDVEKELASVTKEKRIVVDAQDFENAALLRDKERDKQKQLEELKKKWKQDSMTHKVLVKEEDVYETVAKMTGIPVNKISKDESDRLINMPLEIQNKIIGQKEAVFKVSEAIQRARAGVGNPNKPCSFLFLGSTGIGKCFCGDTQLIVRKKLTNVVEKLTINEFVNMI